MFKVNNSSTRTRCDICSNDQMTKLKDQISQENTCAGDSFEASTWMTFVSHFCNPLSIQHLHKTRSRIVWRNMRLVFETKFDSFYSSWKHLNCFFILDWIFLQIRFQICCYFSGQMRIGPWILITHKKNYWTDVCWILKFS